MKIICAMLLMLLCGCSSLVRPDAIDHYQYEGKIVEIKDDQMMILGKDGLVHVGGEFDTQSLKEGMQVLIDTNGTVNETYPMSIQCIGAIQVVKEEDDLIGFYLDVIQDLFDTDPGLNDKIEMIAFDLSKAENLDEAEKDALIWMAGSMLGTDTRTATYDELVEEGLIDDENLYFEKGLLFNLEAKTVDENHFTFTIQKWRSGLGAYWFADCKAVKTDNEWHYEIGAQMIS